MSENVEGFLYPDIDVDVCVDCGLCVKICPLKDHNITESKEEKPVVYAVKHKSLQDRMLSTSGGAFTALYREIIKKEGSVYGVAFDKDKGFKVIHRRATTEIECEAFRGSKYVQSDPLNTFAEAEFDLKQGKYVMYVGTPCQIAGISNFLDHKRKKYEKLILVDFVCHAIPTPLMWKEHLSYQEKKNKSKIVNYQCRSKIKGWHGHTEFITFENGKSIYKSMSSQTYRHLFYSNMVNRESCTICKFRVMPQVSDITIADFWGIEKLMPDFDDNIGISLMLLNTKNGIEYFDIVKNDLIIRETTLNKALPNNNKKEPYIGVSKRLQFWSDYHKYGYEYVLRKHIDLNPLGIIKWHFKNFIRPIINAENRAKVKKILKIQ